MNYCLNYANSSKILIKEAAEINIIYDRNDTSLPAFIEAHKGQRINLIIRNPEQSLDDFEIKKLQAIAEKYPEANLHICLYGNRRAVAIDPSIVARMKSLALPWFTGCMVTTWDAVMYFISLGVSDMYIAEDLGFEVSVVAKICHRHDIAVRIIPNVAQSSINETPALKKFFIRPEDIEVYAPYIDTIEFWGDLAQQDTFYKIYKSGKWMGKLSEIIFSFDSDMESHRILPIFGSSRLRCGKRCLRGFNCTICDSIYEISNHMKNHNLIITSKKKSLN